MGIVNTRNAVVGWAVVKGGKYAVRQKTKESGRRMGAWATGTLAAAAFVTYKARRKRRRAAEPAEPE
jgi:hypothetical protein